MANLQSPTKLSAVAAQLLFDRLQHYDRIIEESEAAVKQANVSISSAVVDANNAWAARKDIAEELGKLAPDDWQPDQGRPLAAMAPVSNHNRFLRPMPFAPQLRHGAWQARPAPPADWDDH